jgi:hypothetical protein
MITMTREAKMMNIADAAALAALVEAGEPLGPSAASLGLTPDEGRALLVWAADYDEDGNFVGNVANENGWTA